MTLTVLDILSITLALFMASLLTHYIYGILTKKKLPLYPSNTHLIPNDSQNLEEPMQIFSTPSKTDNYVVRSKELIDEEK